MDGKRPTILIVDDHPPNIFMLAEALMEDYEIVIATGGQEAIDLALAGEPPDLILLDILMPGMSGYEVCSRLKAESWTKDSPVIFVTAKNTEEDETTGLDCGAVDYITKPFSMPIVKARVRTHLELKRHRDMLENLSLLDGLTAIANRRQFEQHTERVWRQAQREEAWLGAVMADIDFFKAYNDRHGHQAGDECLRQVARTLETVGRRPLDLVARYGGEEFVGVFYAADADGIVEVGRRMHQVVGELGMKHGASPVSPTVTLSIGVAAIRPRPDMPYATLVGAADRALYSVKESSRNAVHRFDFATARPVDA